MCPEARWDVRDKAEALKRRAWVLGELAAMRVPDLGLLVAAPTAESLSEAAKRWQASRVDVAEGTKQLHRVALGRVLPILGAKPVDKIATGDVAALVEALHGGGLKRETIRKSVTVLAQTLDFAGIKDNPARDKVQVRLPREDPADMEPPTADHVEQVCWKLKVDYMLGVLVLDATGVRVGELEGATIGDLDEERGAWLIRGSVSKTRRPRWVDIPADLLKVVIGRLPAREDRDPAAALLGDEVTGDRLRTAIGRACRDAGVPVFSPHALRHRRISLLHRQGESWAAIGERMGQRSKLVTADTYTHVLIDSREVRRESLLLRSQRSRLFGGMRRENLLSDPLDEDSGLNLDPSRPEHAQIDAVENHVTVRLFRRGLRLELRIHGYWVPASLRFTPARGARVVHTSVHTSAVKTSG